tara:strand:- start:90 stop:443 length:354 start_codon:yes stop_codon:yes gene_type:complete
MTKSSKGIGDSIEKVLKATGIDKVAKAILGEDCGCDERKQALNKLYPYARVFTEDEIKIYEEVIGRTKGTITGQDQGTLITIYNKVFSATKKPSSCGSCVKATLNKLKQVYDKSCKI